jgi:hypothetical protein
MGICIRYLLIHTSPTLTMTLFADYSVAATNEPLDIESLIGISMIQ